MSESSPRAKRDIANSILPSVDQARAAMLAGIRLLEPETVALDEALGRTLATPVLAVRDQPPTEPIFSPAGEPLNGGPLGYPTCMQAVANWFARTDARHDGAIDRDAFLGTDCRFQIRRHPADAR